jgi:glycosyl transferase, family 25
MNYALKKCLLLYINLGDALERRHNLEYQFEKYKIKAERLDAIKWSLLDEKTQSSYYSAELNHEQYYSSMVDGEKGCYASHILAWKKFLDSEYDYMVVLEDDIRLAPEFSMVIEAVVDLKISWDMIKLIGRENEKVSSRKHLCEGYELIDYSRIPSYTAGYVISRDGAKKMLESRLPFGRPIDVDLRFWWENNLSIYGVWPAVLDFDQTSSVSTISGRKLSGSINSKWRKFKMKLKLTLGNFWNRFRRKRVF